MEHIGTEWKFLPPALSDGPEYCLYKELPQGYLSTSPTVRVRREGKAYVLTHKGSGLLKQEEYNLLLTAESFARLFEKCDSLRIRRTRYSISLSGAAYTAGFDRFQGEFAGFLFVEVEFPDEASARAFTPPAWFDREVTGDPRCQSPSLGCLGPPGEEKA